MSSQQLCTLQRYLPNMKCLLICTLVLGAIIRGFSVKGLWVWTMNLVLYCFTYYIVEKLHQVYSSPYMYAIWCNRLILSVLHIMIRLFYTSCHGTCYVFLSLELDSKRGRAFSVNSLYQMLKMAHGGRGLDSIEWLKIC